MPIRITRVYTRTGDRGETALVGGRRVPKDAARIEAYGTIDELNAVLGLARVFNAERLDQHEGHRWLDETLRRLQNQLFDLGSELATPEDDARLMRRGVLYCPDYLVNAGGVISVARRPLGLGADAIEAKIAALPGTLIEVLRQSEREGMAPGAIADRIARARFRPRDPERLSA